jgi:hypothetical protein
MALLEIAHRIFIDDDTKAFLKELLGVPDDKLKKALADLSEAVNQLVQLTRANGNVLTSVARDVVEVKATMASKEELSASLALILDKIRKIGDDLTAYLQQIATDIAAGNDVSAQVAQAQQVAAGLQAIDDLIPERISSSLPGAGGSGAGSPSTGDGGSEGGATGGSGSSGGGVPDGGDQPQTGGTSGGSGSSGTVGDASGSTTGTDADTSGGQGSASSGESTVSQVDQAEGSAPQEG